MQTIPIYETSNRAFQNHKTKPQLPSTLTLSLLNAFPSTTPVFHYVTSCVVPCLRTETPPTYPIAHPELFDTSWGCRRPCPIRSLVPSCFSVFPNQTPSIVYPLPSAASLPSSTRPFGRAVTLMHPRPTLSFQPVCVGHHPPCYRLSAFTLRVTPPSLSDSPRPPARPEFKSPSPAAQPETLSTLTLTPCPNSPTLHSPYCHTDAFLLGSATFATFRAIEPLLKTTNPNPTSHQPSINLPSTLTLSHPDAFPKLLSPTFRHATSCRPMPPWGPHPHTQRCTRYLSTQKLLGPVPGFVLFVPSFIYVYALVKTSMNPSILPGFPPMLLASLPPNDETTTPSRSSLPHPL